jgi:hypothetical protein
MEHKERYEGTFLVQTVLMMNTYTSTLTFACIIRNLQVILEYLCVVSYVLPLPLGKTQFAVNINNN